MVDARRRQIEQQKAQAPLAALRAAAEARKERREFDAALAKPGLSVIAELKRASPSRGMIRSDYRPDEIARGYQSAGAAAISVLTEKEFFGGTLSDLGIAREATNLPVLRKDFVVDEYQIYESAAAGADALLLIAAALDAKKLERFLRISRDHRLTVLVEVHTEAELSQAVGCGAEVVGINNRNLATLEVNVETSFALRGKIPPGCLAVSESGIQTAEDFSRLEKAGFDAVLIGERLMSAEDPGRELARLLQTMRSLGPV